MAALISRHGLPAVELHPRICGYEVDFRVVGTRVALECDGWLYHGLERTNFERDRHPDAELSAAGWITVRFTYRAITTAPSATARRIRRTIDGYSAPLGRSASRQVRRLPRWSSVRA